MGTVRFLLRRIPNEHQLCMRSSFGKYTADSGFSKATVCSSRRISQSGMSEEQTDACSSVFRTGRADWIIDEFKQDILVHCGVGMASFSDSRRWMISSMIFSLLLDAPCQGLLLYSFRLRLPTEPRQSGSLSAASLLICFPNCPTCMADYGTKKAPTGEKMG